MDADNFRRIFGEFRFKYSLILRQQDLNPSRLSEYVLLFFLYFIEIRMPMLHGNNRNISDTIFYISTRRNLKRQNNIRRKLSNC